MSSVLDCCNPCGTVQVTQVPGSEGAPGVDGVDGISAYTTTLTDIIIVVAPGTSLVSVVSSVWMVIGQVVIIGSGFGTSLVGPGPAHFTVINVPTATSVEIEYIGSVGDVAPGDTISAGAIVSPSAA